MNERPLAISLGSQASTASAVSLLDRRQKDRDAIAAVAEKDPPLMTSAFPVRMESR